MKRSSTAIGTLLRAHRLRDTEARRIILTSLLPGKPVLPEQVHERIRRRGGEINLVTVYRTLASFDQAGLAHRLPDGRRFTLCELPGTHGHHGFLRCQECGDIEEFHDPILCKRENEIARKSGFRPVAHVTEIVGTCASCKPPSTRSSPRS